MLAPEPMKSRRSRGAVPERWSLAAVVTADVSRAELFLVFSKELLQPAYVEVVRLTPCVVTGTEPNRVYIAKAHRVSLRGEVNAVHELHAADV